MDLGLTQVSRMATSLSMGATFPSAYASYPEAYKFIGLTISVDDKRSLISRHTYSLLEFLGDIGGLFEFLHIFLSVVVYILTSMKFVSEFANKMFEWYEPHSFNTIPSFGQKITEKARISTHIKIPKCLELLTVCCCQPKWFR